MKQATNEQFSQEVISIVTIALSHDIEEYEARYLTGKGVRKRIPRRLIEIVCDKLNREKAYDVAELAVVITQILWSVILEDHITPHVVGYVVLRFYKNHIDELCDE